MIPGIVALIFLTLHSCGPPAAPLANSQRDSAGESSGLLNVQLRISDEGIAQVFHGGNLKGSTPAGLSFRIGEMGEFGPQLGGHIALSGNGSLVEMKKSYRFDITGDADAMPWPGVRSVKLAAQSQDPSFLRTLLGQRIYASLELPFPQVQPIQLRQGNANHGLFLLIERVNEEFFERRGITITRLYKPLTLRAGFGSGALSDPETELDSVEGGIHTQEISDIARWAVSPVSPSGLQFIESRFDTENMIRFFAAQFFLANWDGFTNNFYLFNSRADSRFRFALWDWDKAYDGNTSLEHMKSMSSLFTKVLEYPEFQERFGQIVAGLLERFSPEAVRAILEDEKKNFNEAYERDPYLRREGHHADEELEKLFEKHRAWRSELEGVVCGLLHDVREACIGESSITRIDIRHRASHSSGASAFGHVRANRGEVHHSRH